MLKTKDNYCNNCGKYGHVYHQCKLPIMSNGIIAFRYNIQNQYEYLIIRRKDSLGLIDFMRGKYSVSNKQYILNMLNQMTNNEKQRLLTNNFNSLWTSIWGENSTNLQYRIEEMNSNEKFTNLKHGIITKSQTYTLNDLVNESNALVSWEETEWGFPKGRRDYQETNYDCALREFQEETGYNQHLLKNIQNIIPYDEIFTGSNYKSYKHKYYIMYLDYNDSLDQNQFEPTEVSKMEWKTYDECISLFRPYNSEKIQMLTKIHRTITRNVVI